MNSKDTVTKKKKRKKKRNPFRFLGFDFIKLTGALNVLLWLRPKVLYENKAAKKNVRGGAVIVANHSGFTDVLALYCAFWYRRLYFIAIDDLFKKKISAFFFRSALCIPVTRDNFNMECYRAAVDVLDDGRLLGIFPEGAINWDRSSVNSFKSGAVLIALKGHAPIVPVYIVPPRKWYNRSIVVVGEPIDPAKICGSTPNLHAIDEVSMMLHEKELELKEIYTRWKTKKSSK